MISKAKKMVFVSALVFSIVAASAYGAKVTFAQDASTQSTLVQKIADKFGLKVSDVQAVFDQQRQEHQAVMEQKYEQMLADAVSKGNLTEEKKQLLLTKHKELQTTRQAEMDTWKSMTPDQRKAAMEKKRTELEAWAKSNGVDLKYLAFGRRAHGFGYGMKQE